MRGIKVGCSASLKQAVRTADRRTPTASDVKELGPAPRPNLGTPPGFRVLSMSSRIHSNIETPHGELTIMAPRAVFDTEQIRDKARKDLLHLLEGVS